MFWIIVNGLWGVCTVVGTFAIGRLVRDLDKNTKATESVAKSIEHLSISMAVNTVSKEEWIRSEEKSQKLNDRLVRMESREEMRDEMRAILGQDRRKGE